MNNPLKNGLPPARILMRPLSLGPFLALGLALAAISGCSGIKSDYQEKIMYRLSAMPRMAAAKDTKSGKGLLVKRFSIAPEFDAAGFTYRLSNTRFAADYYHNYMVPPARMITDLAMEALYASPRFSPVSPDSLADIDYQLWGKIIEIYGDARDKQALKSVISIRMVLDQNTGENFVPVIHKTYTAAVSMSEPSPEAYVQGLNQGLTRILDAFFNDLAQAWPGPAGEN